MAANKLITDLRTECLKRGCGGIKGLGVVFRQMDADFSKRLCFEEFQQGMNIYGVPLGEENMKMLFKEFDRDHNGSIDFCEFMHNLRPPMTVARINVINEAFNKLDVNKDQVIKVDDLQGKLKNKRE